MFYEGVFQNLAFCLRPGATGPQKHPKATPKSTQNGPPNSAGDLQNTIQKKGPYPALNLPPKPQKRHPKWTPKSQRIDPGAIFYTTKKTLISRSLFSHISCIPERAKPRKYLQITVGCDKIEVYPFPGKTDTFPKKPPKVTSPTTPKATRNRKKQLPAHLWKHTGKKHENNTGKKSAGPPVKSGGSLPLPKPLP